MSSSRTSTSVSRRLGGSGAGLLITMRCVGRPGRESWPGKPVRVGWCGAKQHLAYRPPPAPGACCVGPLRSGADGTGAPSSEYPFSVPVLVRARLQPRPGDRGPSLATSVAPMEARPRTPRAQGPRLRGPKQHKYSYRGGPLHPPPPHSHVDFAAAAPRSAQNLAHIAQRTSRGGRAARRTTRPPTLSGRAGGTMARTGGCLRGSRCIAACRCELRTWDLGSLEK